MTKQGLAIVAARLRKYANHSSSSNTSCSCFLSSDLEEKIGEAVDEIEREPRQLCLNCIKSGLISVREGNCKAGSRRECKLRKSPDDEVTVDT